MIRIRTHILPVFAVAFVAAGALLHVAQMVHHKQEQVRDIEARIAAEREAIRVLKAEWAYLNSPMRLEALTQEYLILDVPEPASVFIAPEALPHIDVREDDLTGALYHEVGLEADFVKPAPQSQVIKDRERVVRRRDDAPAFVNLLQEQAP